MARILIKNGRVWDGERFRSVDVLTEGDKIAKMESGITDTADFVYDASGKIVSAGLVDTHVHMRGISSEEFGIHAEMSCFPFGVTAAADAGGEYGNGALLDSFMLKGVVFAPVDIKDNHADFTNTEKMLAGYGDRMVGLKVYFDTQVSDVRDLTPLRETVAFAEAKGLAVMVHSSNPSVSMRELIGTLRRGDLLTHAYHGGKNNAAEDDFECLLTARARGVIIDAGFAGHVHTDFGVLRAAFGRGAFPDTISTDITRRSAYTRGGRYGMTACMSLARTFGMREEDIFRVVTSNPAKALGQESTWGYAKVGRTADLAVFDYADERLDWTDKAGNRIEIQQGYRCVLTVSDGQVVYRD